MTDRRDPNSPPPGPEPTARAEADRQARLLREAAALRDNLRRRKQQTRARQAEPDPGATAPTAGDDSSRAPGDVT